MFTKKVDKPRIKKARDLSLSDSIVMPSGRAYDVRRLEWSGPTIDIECAVPNTANSRREFFYGTEPSKKFEVA